MKSPVLLTLLVALLFGVASSCSRTDYSPEPASYNGFRIDTVVYNVDSMLTDTSGPAAKVVLYSHQGRGAVLQITTGQKSLPVAPGAHEYFISRKDTLQSDMVSICVFEAGASYPSFWMAGSSYIIDGLTMHVSNSKVQRLTMAYRSNEDKKNRHYLGISYAAP